MVLVDRLEVIVDPMVPLAGHLVERYRGRQESRDIETEGDEEHQHRHACDLDWLAHYCAQTVRLMAHWQQVLGEPVLKRLGGFWRTVAALSTLVPRPLRDSAYDLVAAVRQHLFSRPSTACPRLPSDLRPRFDN